MVHLATFNDIPELVGLINSVYRGDLGAQGWTTEAHLVAGERVHEDYLRKLLSTPQSYILCHPTSGGRIEGCVNVQRQDSHCYLGLLSVRASAQNQGLGRKLLDQAEMLARENLSSPLMRMTVIHQRPELVAYYQRRGYVVTGETEPFAGDNIVGQALRDDLYFDILEKRLL